MANSIGDFWDSLSRDEADFVEAIVDELRGQAWSAPVLAAIRDNGGITQANKDRMFELRFGYALDRAGIVPQYEIPGEGQSTIDFGFTNKGQCWRVEMVRLGETQAVKHGRYKLTNYPDTHKEDVLKCITTEPDIVVWLDSVELSFRCIEGRRGKYSNHDRQMAEITIPAAEAVDELNERFMRAASVARMSEAISGISTVR